MATRTRDSVAEQLEVLRVAHRDPDAIRRRAIQVLRDVAGSDGGGWYDLGMVDGDPVPVRWILDGVADCVIRTQAVERIPNPTGDPRLAPRERHSRFMLLGSLLDRDEEFQGTPLYQKCWVADRIEDQLRMTVYHRGEHSGWIGVTRRRGEPRFSRADARRIARLARPIADALVRARAIERAGSLEAPGDLVVTPDGRFEYASASIRAYIQRPAIQTELRAWVRALDRGEAVGDLVAGHRVRWSRLDAQHGAGSRYLLHFDPVVPVGLHPAFAISRTARRIATLAVAGATAPEIAGMLSITAATVRTHLRQTYEMLHVSTRVELARALIELPEET